MEPITPYEAYRADRNTPNQTIREDRLPYDTPDMSIGSYNLLQGYQMTGIITFDECVSNIQMINMTDQTSNYITRTKDEHTLVICRPQKMVIHFVTRSRSTRATIYLLRGGYQQVKIALYSCGNNRDQFYMGHINMDNLQEPLTVTPVQAFVNPEPHMASLVLSAALTQCQVAIGIKFNGPVTRVNISRKLLESHPAEWIIFYWKSRHFIEPRLRSDRVLTTFDKLFVPKLDYYLRNDQASGHLTKFERERIHTVANTITKYIREERDRISRLVEEPEVRLDTYVPTPPPPPPVVEIPPIVDEPTPEQLV